MLIQGQGTFQQSNTGVRVNLIVPLWHCFFLAEDFLSIEPNSRNGMENGLRLLVDVETFEYSYFPRGSEGFNIALADSRDRAIVRQQGADFRSKCSDKSCAV